MCLPVLLMVLWLLLGTGLRFLAVELLSTAEPLCPSGYEYYNNYMIILLVPLSVSFWNDLSDPVFDGVGMARFKSKANAFLMAYSALSFYLLLFSLFLPSMG